MPEREARYTIDGGSAGKQRLDVLAAVMRPHTAALLGAVGVPAGARCLDAGYGGGQRGHVGADTVRAAGPRSELEGRTALAARGGEAPGPSTSASPAPSRSTAPPTTTAPSARTTSGSSPCRSGNAGQVHLP